MMILVIQVVFNQTLLVLKVLETFDFSAVKQISMAGSPTYTADTVRTVADGDVLTLTGTITVANSSNAVQQFRN